MRLSKLQLSGKNISVAGIGNPMRGDDIIGVYVADKLIEKGYAGVYNCESSPENYLAKICSENTDTVIFVDAVNLRKDPGRIDIIESEKTFAGITTHNAGIDMVAEYIKNYCGAEVYVIAVQPGKLEGEITPEVKEAGDKIIEYLEKLLCTNQ